MKQLMKLKIPLLVEDGGVDTSGKKANKQHSVTSVKGHTAWRPKIDSLIRPHCRHTPASIHAPAARPALMHFQWFSAIRHRYPR